MVSWLAQFESERYEMFLALNLLHSAIILVLPVELLTIKELVAVGRYSG